MYSYTRDNTKVATTIAPFAVSRISKGLAQRTAIRIALYSPVDDVQHTWYIPTPFTQEKKTAGIGLFQGTSR